MTDNFIKLKEQDTILRLKIKSSDGKETGEVLTFDLEDVELPLKYQEMLEKDKKNIQWLKNQLFIIEKRQDVKGKKLYSKNEEDEIKAINEYFKKEVEIFDIFLGENGVKKLLNGRKLGWTTLKEIDLLIEEQIKPYLDKNMIDIKAKIKSTYGLKSKDKDEIEVID